MSPTEGTAVTPASHQPASDLPAIACHGLTLSVGKRVLATGLDLTVGAGELHAVMGRSGSGKSTLLWTILGLLPHKDGTIAIAGERVSARRASAAAATRRRHTGIVYQQPNLIPELSVIENVSIPLMMTRGLDRATAERTAQDALADLGIDPNAKTGHLSGGEQQRVSIARAAVGVPRVILADEPTAALDEESAALVMDTLIGQCRAQGTALLMVTHDSRIAARADVCWELRDERLTRLRLTEPTPAVSARG